jgi:hypothetical protein
VHEGILALAPTAERLGSTHPDVLASLGGLYADTVSHLRPRVMVQGNPHYLGQAAIVSEIRAVLLAALRSAVLWRQLGGSLGTSCCAARDSWRACSRTCALGLKAPRPQRIWAEAAIRHNYGARLRVFLAAPPHLPHAPGAKHGRLLRHPRPTRRQRQVLPTTACQARQRFDLAQLPYSMKILLENLLRHEDGVTVHREHIEAVATWDAKAEPDTEIAFMPARVVLQDFTGVPCVVDLAAMRDAVAKLGGDANQINPLIPPNW